MLQLHGAVNLDATRISDLKKYALIFDRFQVLRRVYDPIVGIPAHLQGDYEFLESKGIIDSFELGKLFHYAYVDEARNDPCDISDAVDEGMLSDDAENSDPDGLRTDVLADYLIRQFAASVNEEQVVEMVPICLRPLPQALPQGSATSASMNTVLRVALDALPVPSEDCPWQDILDFKADLHDKQWGFRRFLRSLATKPQTSNEIRDELEWLVNEYAKAMKVHKMKSSQSAVDVFVITPLEILESLIKLNWSKIAKGALQVRKRQVELIEAEMKAPGRECAYIFDARKRFGPGP
jgi:hypothetical protein